MRLWLESHLWINTRFMPLQRWAHKRGFCHVEKCPL